MPAVCTEQSVLLQELTGGKGSSTRGGPPYSIEDRAQKESGGPLTGQGDRVQEESRRSQGPGEAGGNSCMMQDVALFMSIIPL